MSLRTLTLVAVMAAAIFVVVPFWPWILTALWSASLVIGWRDRLEGAVGSRARTAALLTLALVVGVTLPLALALAPLSIDGAHLARRLVEAGDARAMLEAIARDDRAPAGGAESVDELTRLAFLQGGRAWTIARSVAGATSRAVMGALVFVVVAYGRLSQGEALFAWFRRYAPIETRVLDRLADAFVETGRGLVFGIGGAALAQATVATIAYVFLRVPHPLVLGVLTFFAALVPGLGSALAWGPVVAGLALAGRPAAAVGMAAIGLGIVGTIDNIVKPLLTRFGQLQLSAAVIFVSMLGGFAVLGPTGILLGPLVLRLAKELLVLGREEAS